MSLVDHSGALAGPVSLCPGRLGARVPVVAAGWVPGGGRRGRYQGGYRWGGYRGGYQGGVLVRPGYCVLARPGLVYLVQARLSVPSPGPA